jgi:hypothetical protein
MNVNFPVTLVAVPLRLPVRTILNSIRTPNDFRDYDFLRNESDLQSQISRLLLTSSSHNILSYTVTHQATLGNHDFGNEIKFYIAWEDIAHLPMTA